MHTDHTPLRLGADLNASSLSGGSSSFQRDEHEFYSSGRFLPEDKNAPVRPVPSGALAQPGSAAAGALSGAPPSAASTMGGVRISITTPGGQQSSLGAGSAGSLGSLNAPIAQTSTLSSLASPGLGGGYSSQYNLGGVGFPQTPGASLGPGYTPSLAPAPLLPGSSSFLSPGGYGSSSAGFGASQQLQQSQQPGEFESSLRNAQLTLRDKQSSMLADQRETQRLLEQSAAQVAGLQQRLATNLDTSSSSGGSQAAELDRSTTAAAPPAAPRVAPLPPSMAARAGAAGTPRASQQLQIPAATPAAATSAAASSRLPPTSRIGATAAPVSRVRSLADFSNNSACRFCRLAIDHERA